MLDEILEAVLAFLDSVNGRRPKNMLSDVDKTNLASFHKTISEQLNSRLSESPRFFGVVVIITTAYGYVFWNLNTDTTAMTDTEKIQVFRAVSMLAYISILWGIWYLAALGYAFRYLQNAQHRIEDDLGWGKDKYRSRSTGIPPQKCGLRPKEMFWLLPGIYHAHLGGLLSLSVVLLGMYFIQSSDACEAMLTCGIGLIMEVVWTRAWFCHYLNKFRMSHVPAK